MAGTGNRVQVRVPGKPAPVRRRANEGRGVVPPRPSMQVRDKSRPYLLVSGHILRWQVAAPGGGWQDARTFRPSDQLSLRASEPPSLRASSLCLLRPTGQPFNPYPFAAGRTKGRGVAPPRPPMQVRDKSRPYLGRLFGPHLNLKNSHSQVAGGGPRWQVAGHILGFQVSAIIGKPGTG